MKFEDKIKELEKIVNDLESGNIDLDKAIDKYSKAMKLISECDKELKSVEEKISKIVKENGDLEDFDIEDK